MSETDLYQHRIGPGKKIFLKKEKFFEKTGETPSVTGCLRTGDSKKFESIRMNHPWNPIQGNVDLTESGHTPLHVVTVKGHETVTEQLITARCNVDVQENDCHTPLHFVTRYGYETVTPVTKQLIDV
jgi:hypothetical protein